MIALFTELLFYYQNILLTLVKKNDCKAVNIMVIYKMIKISKYIYKKKIYYYYCCTDINNYLIFLLSSDLY